MTLNQAALEKASEAIWDTWCASPAGQETAPEGGALSWVEIGISSVTNNFSGLAAMVALVKKEASAAITAYLAELTKTHAIVPRELDDDLINCCMDDRPRGELEKILCREMARKTISALIAEIDERIKADG